MSPHTKIRRWPRFVAYLPIQCTTLDPESAPARPLDGKTQCVSPGGLALLLPETVPPGTPVSIRVCEEEPRQARVVWIDRRVPTFFGTTIPHGVAFDQPVDPNLISQWVSFGGKQSEPRLPARFDVKFESTQARRSGHGTCLNLSREGMFIATSRPAPLGTEVLLHFRPPGLSKSLSVLARVAWKRGQKKGSSAISGMGVQFLGVNPLEITLLDSVVDRLREEDPPLPDLPPAE
ncbi:MAG: PilZ domain-containing protein [Candidatus Methylomirabilales bacterium]